MQCLGVLYSHTKWWPDVQCELCQYNCFNYNTSLLATITFNLRLVIWYMLEGTIFVEGSDKMRKLYYMYIDKIIYKWGDFGTHSVFYQLSTAIVQEM